MIPILLLALALVQNGNVTLPEEVASVPTFLHEIEQPRLSRGSNHRHILPLR